MDLFSATRLAGSRISTRLLLIIIAMLVTTESCTQKNVDCLRSIKESLEDPHGNLSSWRFESFHNSSSSKGFICRFTGVECWHNDENRVLNIHLSNMGLRGEFPRGIANCSSLSGLNLSNNDLNGSIPSDIATLIPFVSTLDLSSNKFSGEIPAGIANLPYLNSCTLRNNLLTGRIPEQIVNLNRLSFFSVANNHLSGPVPRPPNSILFRADFANNSGLCGYPLDPCAVNHHNPFIRGFLLGWEVFFVLFLVLRLLLPAERYIIKFKNWKRMIIPVHQSSSSSDFNDNTVVSKMEKFCSRMNYSELSDSTNNFSKNNVITSDEAGITYKAILSNTSCLAVKRFHPHLHIEKIFQLEIMTLARMRHNSVVPLIGFCYESDERLLIYKFMANGSLYNCLFSPKANEASVMEWPLKVKIAVGIAKGIAWLHQNGVVHGGISSKCILLDANYSPKISGLHKFWSGSAYEEDVYGFGMVLLELITLKKQSELVNHPGGMEDYVKSMIEQEQGVFDDEMSHLLRIAAKCVERDPSKRPSILEVYQFHLPLQWVLHF